MRWEAAARCKTGRDPLRIERAGRRGGHGPVTARVSARNKRRKCVDVKFEQFEHGADVGVRGFGATPAEAFEGAAQALFACSPKEPARVRPQVEERLEVEAADLGGSSWPS